MSTLRDIYPVEAEVRSQRDTDEKQENNEADKELDNFAVQGRGCQPLDHLLDVWFQQTQQWGDEEL
jgi:hypothetical protein